MDPSKSCLPLLTHTMLAMVCMHMQTGSVFGACFSVGMEVGGTTAVVSGLVGNAGANFAERIYQGWCKKNSLLHVKSFLFLFPLLDNRWTLRFWVVSVENGNVRHNSRLAISDAAHSCVCIVIRKRRSVCPVLSSLSDYHPDCWRISSFV